jgi:nucleotide-binding universal stress UspA family protein
MKILIPTDFSDSARKAFEYAYALFKGFDNVEFTLLNTYEMPSTGSAGGVMMSLEEAMKKESENDLKLEKKQLTSLYPGTKVGTVSRYGTLENSVSRTNNEEKVDIVVMGTHGASGIKKALIGSNTEKVMETSEVPVISVPKGWEFRPIKRIVYATDLRKMEKLDSLNAICQIADHFDATIHIVYVAEKASDIDLENEVSKLPLNDYFSKRNREFKVIESDKIADGIDVYVQTIDADLIVLFPKATTFWGKIFSRSVTEQLAFQSSVPMLTIKND